MPNRGVPDLEHPDKQVVRGTLDSGIWEVFPILLIPDFAKQFKWLPLYRLY